MPFCLPSDVMSEMPPADKFLDLGAQGLALISGVTIGSMELAIARLVQRSARIVLGLGRPCYLFFVCDLHEDLRWRGGERRETGVFEVG